MLLMESREHYHVELVGPTRQDNLWQAKAADGFAASHFKIDFASQCAVCPAGKTSRNWKPTLNPYGKLIIKIRWSQNDCGPCDRHERRAHGQTADFAVEYTRRSGIEGTLSEAVRAH